MKVNRICHPATIERTPISSGIKLEHRYLKVVIRLRMETEFGLEQPRSIQEKSEGHVKWQ